MLGTIVPLLLSIALIVLLLVLLVFLSAVVDNIVGCFVPKFQVLCLPFLLVIYDCSGLHSVWMCTLAVVSAVAIISLWVLLFIQHSRHIITCLPAKPHICYLGSLGSTVA